jgi:3-hydroxybutyryl-CoA dehydrogenase
MQGIEATLAKGIAKGKVKPDDRDAALARIRGTTSLRDACATADAVIEAVPEDLSIKRAVFQEVEALAPPHALLCTNTSSLSIAEIAGTLKHKERFLGLHFFNPVHAMKLVEVVRGPDTRADVLDHAVRLAHRLGKEPIVVRDSPGFATSRLGIALGLEAMRMVEEGVASAADIDKAMELGYNHPMGPLKTSDLVGLDVRLGIARYLHGKTGRDAFRPPAILEELVKEGKLGKKSGQGFHHWPREG